MIFRIAIFSGLLLAVVVIALTFYFHVTWEPTAAEKEAGRARALSLIQQVQQIETSVHEKYGRYSFNPDEYKLLGAQGWDPSWIVGWWPEVSKVADVYSLEATFEFPVDGGWALYYCTLDKSVTTTTFDCNYDGKRN